MATNDERRADKDSEVKMPDVEKVTSRTAGKWVIWFIMAIVVVLICFFIF